ncbi:MAG: glutamine--fructose-6-phosphate transaminase (isomerizing) [Oscillospiraceae bacterium]|jgi:glucosamine--fructose-6-phosphate aminotransferase (isomerizing)
MCGIVGYVGKKDCTQILLDGLSKLEYRGYDSAGIAVFSDNKIKTVKSQGKLKNLSDKLSREGAPKGICGIGHTRWATHGEPSDINAHPHGNANVTIVHNGIIENYMEIKHFLTENGYDFLTQTDTETVAKLLDYHYKGDPLDAIIRVMGEIRGSFALGIIFKDFENTIFAVRKESPLIVGTAGEDSFIASDVPAILKYTRNYYLLEGDEIAVLDNEGVKFFDMHKLEIEKELQTATWNLEAAEKCGYEHFMLKEIHEQPASIRNTINPRIKNKLPDFSEIGLTDEVLDGFNNIFIVACGTAMHAGIVGKYIIEKLVRIPVTVDIASEFRYRDPIITDKDLVIIISQSGETADSLAALRLAKKHGAKTLAIVNVVGSSIARDADMVIYTYAGLEIAVASTKAYSVQIATMYLLAFRLGLVKGKLSREKCEVLTAELLASADVIKNMLEDKANIQFIASKLVNADSLLFIGRGLDYAMSMEGSLKLKEISYIHSEAYAAGELKHGTISLITEGMPVIAVATQTELFEKTISNIKEVKARGAMVILICHENTRVDSDVADYIIELSGLSDMLMPMLSVVPLQLIAYYTSVLRGCDVDKPRNLAKSVTVE